jgi:DNA-directed RNA polymerase subunit RPC12/RpoP
MLNKKCAICKEQIKEQNPAKLQYEALDDNNEKREYSSFICLSCEKMMEKMSEYFEQAV